jgi:hypothetical protein
VLERRASCGVWCDVCVYACVCVCVKGESEKGNFTFACSHSSLILWRFGSLLVLYSCYMCCAWRTCG